MIALILHDTLRFKRQLAYLESEHSKGNYLPWEPNKGCDTFIIIDDNLLEIIYGRSVNHYGRIKEVLFALTQEAGFHLSFCRVTRPIQVKRVLKGKLKGKSQCRVVHFKSFIDLFKAMIICTYSNYNDNIINKAV